jgi:hypothetical protein
VAKPEDAPLPFVTDVRKLVQETATKAESSVSEPLKEITETAKSARADLETVVDTQVNSAKRALDSPAFIAGGGALAGAAVIFPFTSGWRRALFVPLAAAVSGTATYIGTVGPANLEMPRELPAFELPSFELPAWMRPDAAATNPPPSPSAGSAIDADFGQATKTDMETYPSRKPHTATDGSAPAEKKL